jgi:hypothetical protein
MNGRLSRHRFDGESAYRIRRNVRCQMTHTHITTTPFSPFGELDPDSKKARFRAVRRDDPELKLEIESEVVPGEIKQTLLQRPQMPLQSGQQAREETRMRRRSQVRDWDELRWVAEIMILKNRNPSITFREAGKELGCPASTISRKCRKYKKIRLAWESSTGSGVIEGDPKSPKRSAGVVRERMRQEKEDD